MGYIDDLTNDDIMAVIKYVALFNHLACILSIRKVHCLGNADNEFDFNESFWRYELSLKQYSADPTAPSPNDRLLEIQSETSPSQSTLPPLRPPLIERTGDPSNEDTVARLQTFLATNSRRNSFSQEEHGIGPSSGINNGSMLSQRDLEMMLSMPEGENLGVFPFPWLFSSS